MIGYLRGTVMKKESGTLLLEVNGVGYEIDIPLSTYYQAGQEGEEAELHIHTHVREDALTLFGFASSGERTLFRKLITLSGIGPKLALAIIGGIGPGELLSAVEAGNLPAITAIPGVGKKTAERLVLELKSSVAQLRTDLGSAAGDDTAVAAGGGYEDVISALENLGFKRAQAEKALAGIPVKEETDFEELLRLSLRQLTS